MQTTKQEKCPYFVGCNVIFKSAYYCYLKYKKCVQYQIYEYQKTSREKLLGVFKTYNERKKENEKDGN